MTLAHLFKMVIMVKVNLTPPSNAMTYVAYNDNNDAFGKDYHITVNKMLMRIFHKDAQL